MAEVTDNTTKQRFELEAGGATAFMDYAWAGDVVTLKHTEVPEALSGQGVGSQLVRGVLDRIRAEGGKVVPRCPFVQATIERHPEYRDLVAQG